MLFYGDALVILGEYSVLIMSEGDDRDPSVIVAGFIENQNKINEMNTKFIEDTKKDREDTKLMLQKLMETLGSEPPRKKRKVDNSEGENSATQQHTNHDEALALNIEAHEKIHDLNNDHDGDDDEDPWTQVEEHELNEGLSGVGDLHDAGDNLEATLGSEFQDLLESTEEILGDPIDEKLASVVEQTWGKCLLSTEKRTALWKGINIPSNCKVLKAKSLNTKIKIRVNENVWKKDKAAQERQKGLSRAAIPVLYSMGNMSKTKENLGKCYKICSTEPKTLEEAKKFLEAIKKHTKEAHDTMSTTSTKLQQSVKVLAYDYTAATRKRKQDVTGALGTAFNPYSQDTKTSEDNLFDNDTMKMMKNELNQVKLKSTGTEFNSAESKNSNYPGKSPRGGQNHHQGNFKKTFNNSKNYNNYNNKNQPKSNGNKFNKNKGR